ncbi:MAG: geranylgeranylglycerol-phosphate geranylgeranyltransferase [Bacteroidetes bacterium]|nr:geranylgeranylglycerol-phosphate geranylgeranyltransferase [Bacteroidota bacterium]
MLIKGMTFFKWVKAVSRLTRLPNVLIIILTQVLLRYCILEPYLYADAPEAMSPLPYFLVMVFVTVVIAIGGYVINDYFDVKIDSINRPEKLVVNKLIGGLTAIKLHLFLNAVAILLGFYLSWRIKAISFGFVFPFISGLLWIYSAKYKRVLFWGNFIVAGLSAFVILVVLLFEFFWLRMNAVQFMSVLPDIRWVTYVFFAYAIFAFLVSMVREIIKDMEDTEGDEMAGCQTLPIVVGIKYTRYVVFGILIVTVVLLAYAMVILNRLSLFMAFWYFVFTVQTGALYLMVKLYHAREKQDYHYLSSLCKLIMVAGILSMEVILISN